MIEMLRQDQESNDRYDQLRQDLKKLQAFTEDFIDDVIERARMDDMLYQQWAGYAAKHLEDMGA